MLELFYTHGSPYAHICRMACRERGLIPNVVETLTTLRDPAAHVLVHNPSGRVPALVLDDGTTISETTLILMFLDQVGSEPGLLPKNPEGMAAYGRVLGLLDGIAVWNRELRRACTERSPSVLELEQSRANRIADALENDIASGRYADIDAGALALLAVIGFAEQRHTVWDWSRGRTHMARWFARASKRISFIDTIHAPG